jgi:hypothetical protein
MTRYLDPRASHSPINTKARPEGRAFSLPDLNGRLSTLLLSEGAIGTQGLSLKPIAHNRSYGTECPLLLFGVVVFGENDKET